jgi:hypothetical protein
VWARAIPRNSQGPASGTANILHGAFAEHLGAREQGGVAGTRQALIEEQLPRGQDHGAVHIVLRLLIRQVADAHRAHAAVAFQRIDDPLLDVRLPGDAVQRLQVAAGIARDDVIEIAQVAFHGVGRAQVVQGENHEEAVAQPAEAVVPVAHAAGHFRNRGGESGEHRAGILIGAQLQRDRGANHRLLPVEGNREAADPLVPVSAGLIQPRARQRERRLLDGGRPDPG